MRTKKNKKIPINIILLGIKFKDNTTAFIKTIVYLKIMQFEKQNQNCVLYTPTLVSIHIILKYIVVTRLNFSTIILHS